MNKLNWSKIKVKTSHFKVVWNNEFWHAILTNVNLNQALSFMIYFSFFHLSNLSFHKSNWLSQPKSKSFSLTKHYFYTKEVHKEWKVNW